MPPKDKQANRGQEKLHTVRNPTTGEEREVSQADWKRDREALQQEGFERVDEVDQGTVAEAPETNSTAG